MTKEEYAHQGLEDGKEVSFQIRQYRVLGREAAALPPESELQYPAAAGAGGKHLAGAPGKRVRV